MATGRLETPIAVGNVLGANTTVYTVPVGSYTVCNVSLTNTTTTAVTVRLALATNAATPGIAEYIEYDTVIAGKGVFERTGLVMQAGLNLVAVASVNASLSATVYGIETSIT
jgi:hypothetical protein|tara:strand:+ start:6800 stop:7135 length:336 start_codon:yes stop_codon:yes gene_type:complete